MPQLPSPGGEVWLPYLDLVLEDPESLSGWTPRDPFEGSQLSGFSLSAVGSILAARRGGDEPEEKVTALWSLVRAGGGQEPHQVPRYRVECLHKQHSGVFTPPVWPASIPVSQRVMKEDEAWCDIQAQWGIHGFAVAKILIKLESAVNALLAHLDNVSAPTQEALNGFKEEINEAVATPLAHTLHMADWYFNKISTDWHKKISKGERDSQLAHWLKDTPESLTQLFPQDISGAMEAARARCTDHLLSSANRANGGNSNARGAASSTSSSFHMQCSEPFSLTSRQHFCGGHSQSFSLGHQTSSARGASLPMWAAPAQEATPFRPSEHTPCSTESPDVLQVVIRIFLLLSGKSLGLLLLWLIWRTAFIRILRFPNSNALFPSWGFG